MVRLPRLFADTTDDSEDSGAQAAGTTSTSTPVSNAAAPIPRTSGFGSSRSASDVSTQLQEIRDAMEEVYTTIKQVNERETTQEKVFNALYEELHDYKNDFLYEHMKPVVRPLLFLYDSLEQFDSEIEPFERPAQEERRNAVAPSLVRQNISYFKEQLVEALRICEVTIMETPSGEYDPKLHKAIEVVSVEAADQDKVIQRVIRNGWYLNGQLLRPAEVVIGRKR